MKAKRLHSQKEREIARYVRDGQWAFMERMHAVGTLWFCVWNKDHRHRKPYPPDLWVCCLMTGMNFLGWVSRHPDWFTQGEWDEEKYAIPIQLTPAGVDALSHRELYEMEPHCGGLCEPGYIVTPLLPVQREREFETRYFTGALSQA